VVISEDDGGLWVVERSDGRPTFQYLFDDISTFTILGPYIQTQTTLLYSVDRTGSRLYPHYDPAFCIWKFFTLLFPLASTWGYFSLLHIHSTDIYRCGVRRFIFLFVVGARHQMEDTAWRR
jgi:hypothetical protein